MEKSLKGTYLSVSFTVIPPQRSDFITTERRKQKMELFLLLYHVCDRRKCGVLLPFAFHLVELLSDFCKSFAP